MASVEARATSCSGTFSLIAFTPASPPRSAIRAPCLISSISSVDLCKRMRIVGRPTSTSVDPGRLASNLARLSRVTWSNSMPIFRQPGTWTEIEERSLELLIFSFLNLWLRGEWNGEQFSLQTFRAKVSWEQGYCAIPVEWWALFANVSWERGYYAHDIDWTQGSVKCME